MPFGLPGHFQISPEANQIRAYVKNSARLGYMIVTGFKDTQAIWNYMSAIFEFLTLGKRTCLSNAHVFLCKIEFVICWGNVCGNVWPWSCPEALLAAPCWFCTRSKRGEIVADPQEGMVAWKKQFVALRYVSGSAEEHAEATIKDYVYHVVAFPFLAIFSLVLCALHQCMAPQLGHEP